jgi:hypothetical protein
MRSDIDDIKCIFGEFEREDELIETSETDNLNYSVDEVEEIGNQENILIPLAEEEDEEDLNLSQVSSMGDTEDLEMATPVPVAFPMHSRKGNMESPGEREVSK